MEIVKEDNVEIFGDDSFFICIIGYYDDIIN